MKVIACSVENMELNISQSMSVTENVPEMLYLEYLHITVLFASPEKRNILK